MPDTTQVQAQSQEKTYTHMKFPAAFVHPYTATNKETGAQYQRAVVNLPQGVNLNGIDLSGFSFDVPLRAFQAERIANNEPVSFGFDTSKPIRLFKGDDELNIKNPWALAKAVKQEREEYAAAAADKRSAPDRDKEPESQESLESDIDRMRGDTGGMSEPDDHGLYDRDIEF